MYHIISSNWTSTKLYIKDAISVSFVNLERGIFSWGISSNGLTFRHICEAYYWFLIDVGGPIPLWLVSLERWPLALWEKKLSKTFVNTVILGKRAVYYFSLSHDIRFVRQSLAWCTDIHDLLSTLPYIVQKRFQQTEKVKNKIIRLLAKHSANASAFLCLLWKTNSCRAEIYENQSQSLNPQCLNYRAASNTQPSSYRASAKLTPTARSERAFTWHTEISKTCLSV